MKSYNNYKKLYDWKKPSIRTWPDNEISEAPMWCSVDLRDGNQALPNPMLLNEKVEFFDYLVSIGFKEIEIGFPSANDTEFQFARYLVENDKIPDDVTIQVLSPARIEMLEKTFESVKGAKKAIVNVYNPISKAQREVVFRKSKEEVKEIAVNSAKKMYELSLKYPETNWQFEYSPESFSNTEMDYALDVVNSVLDVWHESKNKPIINFTATVECSTPNIFADQIEYVCENIKNRDNVIVSLHTHNDRGTSVAASEMGLLAGADRIEGTLFGSGERTGNSDILVIAMNMFVLGIDPHLDFSDINKGKELYEKCTKMPVHPRHPYAGELVFTAFSGSHQDAISKALKNNDETNADYWDIPYLPLNPKDLNRQYESIIRINSQSGKGGITYILESVYGYKIPKKMQKDIGAYFKIVSDKLSRELTVEEIFEYFSREFINRSDLMEINNYDIQNSNKTTNLNISYSINNITKENQKAGTGPIDSFINVLKDEGYNVKVLDYIQESLNENGEKSNAISYINILINDKNIWAIGQDSDITMSSFKAVISAISRAS